MIGIFELYNVRREQDIIPIGWNTQCGQSDFEAHHKMRLLLGTRCEGSHVHQTRLVDLPFYNCKSLSRIVSKLSALSLPSWPESLISYVLCTLAAVSV